jgi:hypothetical protein
MHFFYNRCIYAYESKRHLHILDVIQNNVLYFFKKNIYKYWCFSLYD